MILPHRPSQKQNHSPMRFFILCAYTFNQVSNICGIEAGGAKLDHIKNYSEFHFFIPKLCICDTHYPFSENYIKITHVGDFQV